MFQFSISLVSNSVGCEPGRILCLLFVGGVGCAIYTSVDKRSGRALGLMVSKSHTADRLTTATVWI
jgi:hypothetical protein